MTATTKTRKIYTLIYSEADRTIVMHRPGMPTIKFGNVVPQGVTIEEAKKIAEDEGATLNIVDD